MYNKTAFQSNADHTRMCVYVRLTFSGSCDLDFHSMSLILALDLDILKTCLRNEVSKWRLSNNWAWTGQTNTQTDRRNRTHCNATFASGNNKSNTAFQPKADYLRIYVCFVVTLVWLFAPVTLTLTRWLCRTHLI